MKKVFCIWMTAVMVCAMIPSAAFAAPSSKAVIDETKAEQDIAKALVQALEEYADQSKDIQMMPIGNGTEYCRQVYALKSGDELIMEFTDCKEDETALSPMQHIPAVMPMAANGETVWKDYGNRYFTAKATVTTAAGSGWVSLENHYTLSTNGIDERYGVANAKAPTATGTKIEIDVLGINITDSSARSIGASDVNMYAEYLMRGTGGSAGPTQKTIKLETAVGYVSHNKTTKQIQVKHSWSLKA